MSVAKRLKYVLYHGSSCDRSFALREVFCLFQTVIYYLFLTIRCNNEHKIDIRVELESICNSFILWSSYCGRQSYYIQAYFLVGTLSDQTFFQEETKKRLNSGNACYHSAKNPLSCILLSKNMKIEMYRTITVHVVCVGVQLGL